MLSLHLLLIPKPSPQFPAVENEISHEASAKFECESEFTYGLNVALERYLPSSMNIPEYRAGEPEHPTQKQPSKTRLDVDYRVQLTFGRQCSSTKWPAQLASEDQ